MIGRKKCSKKSLAYRSDREHCRCNKTQRQIKFMETVFDDNEARRVEEDANVDTAVSSRISRINL